MRTLMRLLLGSEEEELEMTPSGKYVSTYENPLDCATLPSLLESVYSLVGVTKILGAWRRAMVRESIWV